MSVKKTVAIWCRVSTDLQGDSIEVHEKRGQLYAEAKEWNVYTVYRLKAVSGKSVMHHPEAVRMLNDLKSGTISGLVFSKLERLARNVKELLEIAELFKSHNADLISLGESIDTSTASGRLFYTLFAAFAEFDRANIVSRVTASIPIRAKLGRPLGGAASYGFRWQNKEFLVDSQEAPIRKLVYELFLKHRRKHTVAQKLNELGYRTRNGSPFSDTTVGRLLRDSTAKGKRITNYTKSLGEKKSWEIKDKNDWVIVNCEPIVSEEVWNECNAILESQQTGRKKPSRKPAHLFTGVAFCYCHTTAKMYVPSWSKKYICSKCKKTRIETSDLEEIFYEHLKSFLLTEDHLAALLENADRTISEKENQVMTMQLEKEKLEKEMEKLVNLHIAGEIPKVGFGKHYNPLNERAKQIEDSIPEVQAELDFLKIEIANSDYIAREAKNLYDRWPELELEEKRIIVEQITESITISENEIKIKFNYTPVPPKNPTETPHRVRGSYWQ